MTALFTIGTTAETSADFTASGGVTLFLTNATGAPISPFVNAEIQVKATNGQFARIGFLTGQEPAKFLEGGTGTYRVIRQAAATPFGVEIMTSS